MAALVSAREEEEEEEEFGSAAKLKLFISLLPGDCVGESRGEGE